MEPVNFLTRAKSFIEGVVHERESTEEFESEVELLGRWSASSEHACGARLEDSCSEGEPTGNGVSCRWDGGGYMPWKSARCWPDEAAEQRWERVASLVHDAPAPLTEDYVQNTLAPVPFGAHLVDMMERYTSTSLKDLAGGLETLSSPQQALLFYGLWGLKLKGDKASIAHTAIVRSAALAPGNATFATRHRAIFAALTLDLPPRSDAEPRPGGGRKIGLFLGLLLVASMFTGGAADRVNVTAVRESPVYMGLSQTDRSIVDESMRPLQASDVANNVFLVSGKLQTYGGDIQDQAADFNALDNQHFRNVSKIFKGLFEGKGLGDDQQTFLANFATAVDWDESLYDIVNLARAKFKFMETITGRDITNAIDAAMLFAYVSDHIDPDININKDERAAQRVKAVAAQLYTVVQDSGKYKGKIETAKLIIDTRKKTFELWIDDAKRDENQLAFMNEMGTILREAEEQNKLDARQRLAFERQIHADKESKWYFIMYGITFTMILGVITTMAILYGVTGVTGMFSKMFSGATGASAPVRVPVMSLAKATPRPVKQSADRASSTPARFKSPVARSPAPKVLPTITDLATISKLLYELDSAWTEQQVSVGANKSVFVQEARNRGLIA